MTKEQAIKLLRKDTSIDEIHRLRDNGLSHTEVTDAIQEAMDLGVDAIEKQIAKKPQVIKQQTRTMYVCSCDITLKWVQNFPNEITCGNEPDYCNHCGQKLDWEVN